MKKNERTKFILILGCVLVSIASLMVVAGCGEKTKPDPVVKPNPPGVYNIIKEATENGSFTVSATKGEAGDEIYLHATPAGEDCEFVQWTIQPGDVTISGPNPDGDYMFLMPEEDVTVGAIFSKFYTVTAAEGITNGSLVIAPARATAGTSIQVTVNADTGFQLVEGSLSAVPVQTFEQQGSTNRYNFVLGEANVVVNAAFEAREYTITKGTVTGGDLTFSADKAVAGTEITLTVKEDADYGWSGWIINPATLVIEADGANYKFTMPATNVTIGAKFSPIPTQKLPTPVLDFFKVGAGDGGVIEMDRSTNNNTRLILGGQGDGAGKSEYDGLGGNGKFVAEARVVGFTSLADANAGTNEKGYYVFRGIEWISDKGEVFDINAIGGNGGGYSWPGNWYLQNPSGSLLTPIFGTGQVWLRAKFVAAGSDRSLDSDFGPVGHSDLW